ncbi:kinase-like domain-containing protein [Butyriboletus roseoflavus]|nr:kinase-like domain-containing protein [Butyriboletus roseoflavus]
MVDALEVEPYIPQFFWRFWLSDADPRKHTLDDHRVHIYDVFNNVLSETRRIPEQTRTVFHDFITDALDEGCQAALHATEQAFMRLENDVERILAQLALQIRAHAHRVPDSDVDSECCAARTQRFEVPMSKRDREMVLRYFVFLRYRNSETYKETVDRLTRRVVIGDANRPGTAYMASGGWPSWCEPSVRGIRLLAIFGGGDVFWSDVGGTTDQDHDVEPRQIFDTASHSSSGLGHDGAIWVDVGIESRCDVHLRNASLLQRNPAHLYFSSLTSLVQALANYDECRWLPEHLDYSRLKQRARHKATLEAVTKTLLVKGNVLLVDLTDEVCKVGRDPVCHGGFSDVWKGIWTNAVGQSRTVALKFLRQYQSVANDVREKLLKCLKTEIAAWHRLQHANICPLYGVIQSVHSIAMVSPWCNNGTIMQYIQREDVHVDRLTLLRQIASGMRYLHNMKPVVVHGDLKGTNILISDEGHALISDFGLSTVVEELSLNEAALRAAQFGTSLLAGSTRWMAPELILSLVEDDGVLCPVTRESDVFSFACVCLEVATNDLPYPHRRNDRAVTIDILRGVRPCRGAPPVPGLRLTTLQEEAFWGVLDQCWNAIAPLRPTMTEVGKMLGAIVG